jgi:ornithine cyclodeaminase
MLILRHADVERAVPMRRAIALVERAFADLSTNKARSPTRLALSIPPRKAAVLFMPAALGTRAVGAKIVSVYPDNPKRGLPRIAASVLLLDPATGAPMCLMEGAGLTALRTGAASGVATMFLARKDARRLAIFGSGPQAITQVQAVAAVRRIDDVRIVSRDPAHANAFARAARRTLPDASVRVARSPADAVRDADVICTATNSTVPVFAGKDAPAGVHVNAIGSYTPRMRELDLAFLRRCDRIVVDQRDAAWAEAGELIHARRKGALRPRDVAELGEVCIGTKPGRTFADQVTLFKSVGNAVQDIGVAHAAFQYANRHGLGRRIAF